MKIVFVFFCSLICLVSVAQTSFLKDAAAKFDKALIAKDTIVLKQLLHKDASYGHSNGWVETKADVIKDLSSGKLAYTKIESEEPKWSLTKGVAILRTKSEIDYELDGKTGELKLHVVQVWLKTNKGWQLLVRQGCR